MRDGGVGEGVSGGWWGGRLVPQLLSLLAWEGRRLAGQWASLPPIIDSL